MNFELRRVIAVNKMIAISLSCSAKKKDRLESEVDEPQNLRRHWLKLIR